MCYTSTPPDALARAAYTYCTAADERPDEYVLPREKKVNLCVERMFALLIGRVSASWLPFSSYIPRKTYQRKVANQESHTNARYRSTGGAHNTRTWRIEHMMLLCDYSSIPHATHPKSSHSTPDVFWQPGIGSVSDTSSTLLCCRAIADGAMGRFREAESNTCFFRL